jgi:N-acetylglucosamine malate deacetylase 1
VKKKLIKLLLGSFSKAARPYLKSYGLLQTSKVFNRSALVWEPAAEKVVVLAPHMDDEIIGCGGTLAAHAARGADVTVIFLTDGRLGGTPTAEQKQRGLSIVDIRKSEARAALAEIGIRKMEFLDAEDGRLGADPQTAIKLRDLLLRTQPEIVYLPYFLEQHEDHTAVSPLLRQAVEGTRLDFQCHSYEVWTPLFPNCFVRIDDTVELKRRALAKYESQLAGADYLHTSLGLAAYRSNAVLDEKCRFVEAFCVHSLQQYLEFYASFALPSANRGTARETDPAPA